jgi:hypothetical protein
MQRLLKTFAATCCLSVILTPSSMGVGQRLRVQQSVNPPALITAEHARAIYQHLVEGHWVPQTGLFISYLNSGDRKLSQQASTYDQAAVGLLALRLGDLKRAEGIFHFFQRAWEEGPVRTGPRQGVYGLTNFYNAEVGREGIEKTIHVGPNAWIGLFAVSLANRTKEREPFYWALKVASWIAHDIPHHQGGVAMGPLDGQDGTPWPKVASVENNISTYALFSELLRSPLLQQKDRAWLTEERDHIEDWLVNTAFDRTAYTMRRGINPQGVDSIHALDTITWLVSAMGPERLKKRGIDPYRLMRVAEKLFLVNVQGHWGVDPTDQSEANATFSIIDPIRQQASRPPTDRHRIIWYEGLGQYINALTTLADYAQQTGIPERALPYTQKAKQLSQQFDRAALKAYPQSAAYAYATPGKFFRDGWWSPEEGAEGPASSLIAATWRCLAGLGMDPLSGKNIKSVQTVRVSLPEYFVVEKPQPMLLFGTSEDMTGRAWELLAHRDFNRSIEQARATIQEWTPYALKLEEKKAHKIGRLLDYTGLPEERKEIFAYWALNDVAAAYFILGKALDEKHQYDQAAAAFQQIALHYPLAQVWDPQGWFWSPLEAIRTDYVTRDPDHYRNVLPEVLAESSFGKQPN